MSKHDNSRSSSIREENLLPGMRRCVDCGRPTGNWCDRCEHLNVIDYPPFPNRPFCTACEETHGVCKYCRMTSEDQSFSNILSSSFGHVPIYMSRNSTEVEQALSLMAANFALDALVSKPGEYEFPNALGRASSILIFHILGTFSEPPFLKSIRNQLNINEDLAKFYFEKAIEKANDADWSQSCARSIIIGTRFILYGFLGMESIDQEDAVKAKNDFKGKWLSEIKRETLRGEIEQFFNFIIEQEKQNSKLPILYASS